MAAVRERHLRILIAVALSISLVSLAAVAAPPLVWHPANEIMGGTFPDPSYIFSQNLTVNGSLMVDVSANITELIINNITSCQVLGTTDDGTVYCKGVGAGGVLGGSGTGSADEGYLARWNGTYTLTDSVIYQNGTNVGIGTTSPTSKLTIDGDLEFIGSQVIKTTTGNLRLSAGSGDVVVDVQDSGTAGLILDYNNGQITAEFVKDWTEGHATIGTVTNHPFRIKTGNVEQVTIDTGGNFGIGTTSPLGKLHVSTTGDANSLVVDDSTGYVGIGTASPGYKLDISGDINVGGNTLYAGGVQAIEFATGVAQFVQNQIRIGSSGSHPIIARSGDNLYFQVGGSEQVRIDTSGNVGIGTTSPQAKLDVNGSAILRGQLNMNSNKITNLAEPTNPSDAATKNYVDSSISGNVSSSINGTPGYIAKFVGQNSIGDSVIFENETTGYVGIGTTNPGEKLEVSGNTIIAGKLIAGTNTWGSVIGSTLADNVADPTLTIKTVSGAKSALSIWGKTYFKSLDGSVTNMYIDTAGNVGIGTTAPENIVHIKTTSGPGYGLVIGSRVGGQNNGLLNPRSRLTITNNQGEDTYLVLGQTNILTGGLAIPANVQKLLIASNGDEGIGFKVGVTFSGDWNAEGIEAMTISSSGNVGIGTTSPSQKLHVVGSTNITQDLFVGGTIYGNIQGSLSGTADNSKACNADGTCETNAILASGDILPSSTNTYNIGSSTNQWNNLYAKTIFQNGNQVIDTINPGNALSGSKSNNQYTLNVNVNTNKGLQIASDQIETKISTGLQYDGSGNIRVDNSLVPFKNQAETITGKWTFNNDVIINKNLYVIGNISNTNVNNLNINGSLYPSLANTFDIGSSTNRWRNLYLSGDADIQGNLNVSGTIYGNIQGSLSGTADNSLACNADGTCETNNIDAQGDITMTGRLYDSGTTYYVDPASTGTSMNVAGSINIPSGKYINVGTADIYDEGTWLRINEGGTNTWIGDGDFYVNLGSGDGTDSFYIRNSTSGVMFRFYSNGRFDAYSQIRAPIYYDSNNLGYYLDPASTSYLYRLGIANEIYSNADIRLDLDENNDGTNYFRIYNGADSQIFYVSESGYTYAASDVSANNVLARGGVFYSNGNIYLDIDNDNNGANYLYIRNGGNANVFSVDESGNTNIQGNLTVSGTISGDISASETDPLSLHLSGGQNTMGQNINMNNYVIQNIGASGTSFSTGGHLTLSGDLTVNGGDIDMVKGQTSQIHSLGQISFDWTTGGTYDNPQYHGIQSKNEAGSWADSLRINSYNDIINTIDSNNNNAVSYFKVQHHSSTDGADLFWVESPSGNGYLLGTLSANDLTVRNKPSCGKLYTDSSGNVLCGTDIDTNYNQWRAADDDGDIYNIVSNNILRFTSSSGAVTTNLINGDDGDENLDLNLNWNVAQKRVSGTCPSGQSIRVINSDGTVTCEVDDVNDADASVGNEITRIDVQNSGGTTQFSLNPSTDYIRFAAGSPVTLSFNSASHQITYDLNLPSCSSGQVLTTTDGNTFSCVSDQQGVTGSGTGSGTAGYLARWTGSTTLGNSVVYENNGNIGIGTTSPGNYKIYAVHDQDADAFYFKGYSSTTGEHDVFTIEEPDVGGGGQDESSVLKVIRTGSFNANDDASTLLELTYTGSTASNDRQFYVVGRRVDEGQVLWGVDVYDADIWTTGGIKAGATGTDCGGTGAACFSGAKFSFDSASQTLDVNADSTFTGDVIIEI